MDSNLEYVDDVETYNDEEKDSIKLALLPLYSNLSICYLQLKDYKNTIEASTEAIKIDSLNVKCLFRRGKARLENLTSGYIF